MKKSRLVTAIETAMRTMTAEEVSATVRSTVNRIAAQRLFRRLSDLDHDFLPPEPPPSRLKLTRNKWLNWVDDSHPCKQGYLRAHGITVEVPTKTTASGKGRSSRQGTDVPTAQIIDFRISPPKRNRLPKEWR